MEFLKDVFGEEALTFDQFSEKAKGNESLNLINLKDDLYVEKEKITGFEQEIEGLKGQLVEANNQIESFKEMDIDGIKTAAEEWKAKYETETQRLNQEMMNREREYSTKEYLSKYQFTSDLAKDAVLSRFMEEEFKMKDGTFLGADDYMKQLMESNKAAFVDEEEGEKPYFTSTTKMKPPKNDEKDFMFNFTGLRPGKEDK